MTDLGIDTAGRPSIAAIDALGAQFVCRYVSTPGNWKNATLAEVQALTAAGKKIVLVFETTADRALAGKAAGAVDAQSALAQAAAVGKPPEAPLYFAVDFPATAQQMPTVGAYFDGVASVLGRSSTGAYGSHDVIKWLLDHNKVGYAWQTYAWSAGAWDNRAHIQQYSNGHTTPDGVGYDLNRATQPIYGQWPTDTPSTGGLVLSATAEQKLDDLWTVFCGKGPKKTQWVYNLWTLLRYGVTASGASGVLQQIKAAQDPAALAAALLPLLPKGDVTQDMLEAAIVGALKKMAADDAKDA